MTIFRRKPNPAEAADEQNAGPRGLPMDAMTGLGLAAAAVGWVLLILALLLSDAMLRAGSLVAIISLRSDIVTVAQTAILSGFALAAVGSLRSGFGALNRFFEAVLHRSAATARPVPAAPPPPDPPAPVPQPIERPAPSKPGRGGRRSNYVILPDGSVEVETLLGTRIFATLDEARDFIH